MSRSLILDHYIPLECRVKAHCDHLKRKKRKKLYKNRGDGVGGNEQRASCRKGSSVVGVERFVRNSHRREAKASQGQLANSRAHQTPSRFTLSLSLLHTHIPQPRSKSTNNHPPLPKYFLAHRRILTGKINQRGWRRGWGHTRMVFFLKGNYAGVRYESPLMRGRLETPQSCTTSQVIITGVARTHGYN